MNYASDIIVISFNVQSDLQLTQGRTYVQTPVIITYTIFKGEIIVQLNIHVGNQPISSIVG